MTNIILESEENFQAQLFKSICTDNNIENECLISGEELEKDHVQLECKHKFNYKSIFYEILNQKKKHNYLEIQKLAYHQIKCPYCRHIQTGILPYKNPFDKITNVNWPEGNCFSLKKCQNKFKSGLRKGQLCNKKCLYLYCNRHYLKKEKEKLIIYCKAILKSGKNKGNQCTYKEYKDGFCKRHKPK